MTVTKPVLATLLFVCLVSGFTVGILIGIFAVDKPGKTAPKADEAANAVNVNDDREEIQELLKDSFKIETKYTDQILNEINPTYIRKHIKEIASSPHVAGTPQNDKIKEYIYKHFEDAKVFDVVENYTYNVLLSYNAQPNVVDVVNPLSPSEIKVASQWKEARIKSGFPNAYHAYSPSGSVMGDLVYANFATDSDFEHLENLKINITGKIVLTRSGKIFRGNKVINAARFGAVGVLMYPDAEEVSTQNETSSEEAISSAEALPEDGIQRGSIYEKIGDPLTPGYPAVETAHRLEEKEANLSDIISQPISRKFAEVLIKHLGGIQEHDWGGRNLGPGFRGDFENYKVKITSHNTNEMKNITNIIGKIEGELEPDRYVIIGNNYDAWGFGAVNPSSSTSQLLEIARVFGRMKEKDWKPRRSIIFAAWDAGKFGQIGSTEWVEEYLDILTSRAVAYINTESCIETDDIEVSASPILKQAVYDVAKLIPDEDKEVDNLFEDWMDEDEQKKRDMVSPLGAESDHAAFAFYAGVPSVDIHSQREDEEAHFYPKQNTAYDTFDLVEAMDKSMSRSVSCAQFTAILARYLADSAVLPLNVSDMSQLLVDKYEQLKETNITNYFLAKGISTFDELGEAIKEFDKAAENFENLKSKIDDDNPLDIRMVNDQMMLVERAFINPEGDYDDWFHRHLLYGPTDLDKNADSVFYVFDELMELVDDVSSEESEENRGMDEEDPYDIDVDDFWDEKREYISDVIMALKEATKILKPLRGVYEDNDDDDDDDDDDD